MQRLGWRLALVLFLMSSTASVAAPLSFLDCAEVNLLGEACDSVMGEEALAPPPQAVASAEPLFTLQTMRPDTPPLLVKVFNDPSDANIAAYKEWQHRYLSRTLEVEQKLKAWDQRQGQR